jgi:Na+/H+ antiporter NhaD/arsenite permease-like protein
MPAEFIASPIILKNVTLFLFALTFVLMIFFDRLKHIIAGISALILIGIGVLSPSESFAAINWNVIGMYIGMFFIAEVFMESKVPELIAGRIVEKSRRDSIAIVALCFFAGILSIFLMNVAVVLIVAPIAFHMSKKLNISAIPIIISIAVIANVQGLATMIGDPASFIFASSTGMSFNDFFFFQGKPSLFFAVQFGALACIAVLYLFFRKDEEHVPKIEHPRIHSYFGAALIIIVVSYLIMTSFFSRDVFQALSDAAVDSGVKFSLSVLAFISDYIVGIICILIGIAAFAWHLIYMRSKTRQVLKEFDWHTCLFLAEIFILIAALMKVGFASDIAKIISSVNGSSLLLSFVMVTVVSMVFSSFVLNIPFIAALMPIIQALSSSMGVSPYLLAFGLAIGVSFGGCMTPIGASANVVAGGILKRHHHHLRFWEWVKMAVPATLASVAVSAVFVWLFFS